MGAQPHPIYGENRTVVALVGDLTHVSRESFNAMDGVYETMRIQEPYKLASRTTRPEDTVLDIAGGKVRIGSQEIVIMAGPCSVESREQVIECAIAVKEAGAKILRGGAFKPRTSPYAFQGLWPKGFRISRGSSRSDRASDHYGGDDGRDSSHGSGIRRYFADRRPQYAKLRSIAGRRQGPTAGHVKTRL